MVTSVMRDRQVLIDVCRYTQIHCGSGLARESGVTGNIDID